MAKDIFHYQVREALEKDGWKITHDPYPVKIGRVNMEVDLGAENTLAAERDGSKIAVEIKSFLNKSNVYDFHEAVGQYVNYRMAMRIKEPGRELFLAIPHHVWDDFFQNEFVQMQLENEQIHVLTFNPIEKNIVIWKR